MTTANFRTIGNGFRGTNGRGNNNAGYDQQPVPQQQGFGYNNREEEPVVAWLNIMVGSTSGEKKKLGKGIPLRDNNPLERAILNLIMDADGNDLGFDTDILKQAITLDIRPAGQADSEFDIALAFENPAPKPQKSELDSAIEEEEPAPKPQTVAPKRRTLASK